MSANGVECDDHDDIEDGGTARKNHSAEGKRKQRIIKIIFMGFLRFCECRRFLGLVKLKTMAGNSSGETELLLKS